MLLTCTTVCHRTSRPTKSLVALHVCREDFCMQPHIHLHWVQATWLLQLAKQDEATAQKAFASIPDFVIRDMTAWLSFVIRGGQPDLVASCRLDVLIAFLVEMLQRGDLVQSPIIHAKIVELLLTMLSPQLGRQRGRGMGLCPSYLCSSSCLCLQHTCVGALLCCALLCWHSGSYLGDRGTTERLFAALKSINLK